MAKINKVIYSIENYQARTILELLRDFTVHMNDVITATNDCVTLVDEFKEYATQRITEDILEIIQDMYDDGRLASIIGDTLTDLNSKVTLLENELDSLKTTSGQEISGIKSRLHTLESKPDGGLQPSDIVDNLDSWETGKALSANQGRILKAIANTPKPRGTIKPGFLAHRGFHMMAPENTVKAVRMAGEQGYSMVEIDVRLSSDGQFVCVHDETVDRTTNGTGYVSNMTLSQLKQLRITNDASGVAPGGTAHSPIFNEEVLRIPSLEEVLQECAYWGMGINIDGGYATWNDVNVGRLVALLRKYDMEFNSMISTSQVDTRPIFVDHAPNLMQCMVTSFDQIDNMLTTYAYVPKKLFALKGNGVALSDNATAIAKCHLAGVPVMMYEMFQQSHVGNYLGKGVLLIESDSMMPQGGLKNE